MKGRLFFYGVSLLFIVVAALWSGCDKTDFRPEGKLQLVFTPRFGTEAFSALQAYAYGNDQSIKISKFEFYITGISLISSFGNAELEKVGLIDFTGNDTGSAIFQLDGINPGEYSGIKFSIGVIPDLNSMKPKDFKSSNPLSSTSHYWESWNSYIFSKIEGILDTSGAKSYDLGFVVHTGSDECLATLTLAKNFNITDQQTSEIDLDLDLRRVFQENGNFFNFVNSPINHSLSNLNVLKLFTANIAQSIQVKN